jgi:hypothetical protein
MADDLATLMKSEGTEKAKGKERKKIGGEERVPELFQWKEREMAEGIEELMTAGRDDGDEKDSDVEMGG